jgi:hypothetical protein
MEDWVRREWLPKQYEQGFSRERLKLSSGGVFDFDAVSADGSIVATVSTSRARTKTGKYAVGKMLKLRSDMFFLLLIPMLDGKAFASLSYGAMDWPPCGPKVRGLGNLRGFC